MERKVEKTSKSAAVKGKKGFQKGMSGNPNGRPKGIVNKTNEQIKEAIRTALSGHLEKLDADLKKMKPFQRWTVLDRLSRVVIPSLTRADIEANVNGDMKITVLFADKTAPTSEGG